MTNQPDETRRINCTALRTLQALERTFQRHIDDLMAVDCEDAEAAEAIVFAIEAAEAAITNARAVRQRVMKG
jgi:hypothetical protein